MGKAPDHTGRRWYALLMLSPEYEEAFALRLASEPTTPLQDRLLHIAHRAAGNDGYPVPWKYDPTITDGWLRDRMMRLLRQGKVIGGRATPSGPAG